MRKKILSFLCIIMILIMTGCSRTGMTDQEQMEDVVPDQLSNDVVLGEGDRQEESVGWYATKVAYANWSEDDRIIRSCLNPEAMAISSQRHLPVYKFETKSEIDQFKDKFQGEFTFDQGYNDEPSFNEVTAYYDDRFFAERSIVMVYVSSSSGSFRFDIESVSLDDSSMCINVYQTNDPEVYTADMAGWFIIAELDQTVVSQCESFDAKMVLEGKDFKTAELPGFKEFGTFSWKQIERELKAIDETSAEHVKTEGFVNTEPVVLTGPVERAKAEATIEYTLIQYFFDQEEDMWMVRFFSSEEEGPLEEVYMDGNGVTMLIIFANVARYDG